MAYDEPDALYDHEPTYVDSIKEARETDKIKGDMCFCCNTYRPGHYYNLDGRPCCGLCLEDYEALAVYDPTGKLEGREI